VLCGYGVDVCCVQVSFLADRYFHCCVSFGIFCCVVCGLRLASAWSFCIL